MPATIRIDFDVHAESISAALEAELSRVKGIVTSVNSIVETSRKTSTDKLADYEIKEQERIQKEAIASYKQRESEQKQIAKAFLDYEKQQAKERELAEKQSAKEIADYEKQQAKEVSKTKTDESAAIAASAKADAKKIADEEIREQKRIEKEAIASYRQREAEQKQISKAFSDFEKQQTKERAHAEKQSAKEISDYEKLQEKERLSAIKEREKQEQYMFKLKMKSIADAEKAEEKAAKEVARETAKANAPKEKSGGGGIGLAGGIGIGAAIAGFQAIREKAKEADEANDELKMGLSATGLAGKKLAEENKAQSENAKQFANDYKGVSEEAAKKTIAMIATMSHKSGAELKALSEDAIILAHGDAEKAVAIGKMLGKASNDEIEGSAAKLGIALDKNMTVEQRAAAIHDQAMKSKKAVQDADNDSLGTLNQIMNKVMTTVSTLAGTLLDSLKPTFDAIIPLVDQLGALLSTTLKPVIDAITPVITMVAESFAKLAPPITALVTTALALLTPILGIVIDVLKDVLPIITDVATTVMESLTPVFTALTPIIKDLTAIFKAEFMLMLKQELIPIIYILVPILTDLLVPVLMSLIPLIKMITDIMLKTLVPAFTIVGDIMKWLGEEIIQPLVKWFSGKLVVVIQDTVAALMKIVDAVMSVVKGVGSLLGLGGDDAKAATHEITQAVVEETKVGEDAVQDVHTKAAKKKGAAKKEEHKKELQEIKATYDEEIYQLELKNAKGLLRQDQYERETFLIKEAAAIKERDLWSKNSAEYAANNEKLLQLRRQFELKNLAEATKNEIALQKMLSEFRISFLDEEEKELFEKKIKFVDKNVAYEDYQLKLQKASGAITEEQYQAKIYEIKLKALKDQLALFDPLSKEYADISDSILQSERDHAVSVAESVTAATDKMSDGFKNAANTMFGFADGISGVIKQITGLQKAETARNKESNADLDKELAKLDKQTQSKLKLAKTDKDRSKISADSEKEQLRLMDANEKKQKEVSEQGQQLSVADKIASLAKAASGMVSVVVGIMEGSAALGPFGIFAAPALIGAAVGMYASAKSSFGFMDGGFTGNGDPRVAAGTVHKNEFVLKSGSFAVDSNGNLVSVAGMGGGNAAVVHAINKQTDVLATSFDRPKIINQRRMVLENKVVERSRNRETV